MNPLSEIGDWSDILWSSIYSKALLYRLGNISRQRMRRDRNNYVRLGAASRQEKGGNATRNRLPKRINIRNPIAVLWIRLRLQQKQRWIFLIRAVYYACQITWKVLCTCGIVNLTSARNIPSSRSNLKRPQKQNPELNLWVNSPSVQKVPILVKSCDYGKNT